MPGTHHRPIWLTLLGCSVVGLICGPPHRGIMLWILAPFVSYWLLHCGYLLVADARQDEAQPKRARIAGLKLGLWLATIGICLCLHLYYAKSARTAANALRAQIESYRDTRGVYPKTLDALRPVPSAQHWHLMYFNHDGKPALLYPATSTIFDTYDYNFETRQWDYWAD